MSDKFKDYLVEESNKPKLKPRLHKVDDKIETFIEMIESRIDEIDDNPIFAKKMNQLLVDMSKEHGEFMLALRSIVAALDRGAQRAPTVRRPDFAARGVNPMDDTGERDYNKEQDPMGSNQEQRPQEQQPEY